MEDIVFIAALALSMLLPLFVPKAFIRIRSRKNNSSLTAHTDTSASDEPLLNQ